MVGIGAILVGVYISLIGFRIISASKKQGEEYEKWYATWGSKMKIIGPVLIIIGIITLFIK
ncbi:MAG: hypothetical protein COS99_03790 [Candidatus Omnitrophica bacterium CG07_land_8_20_14_0_80_42_15]|uniref:Uncharacterized protein n=1 Tax=Candidatus Aquitaenariimonas noxiae TaxID=1974741 RepID=A0A2J0KTD3_9BACT|nr:MAG: hypothetical protein COS99_03790 [Candidatus Omnitrophica bacterium CG07_land_8_20_14_0_80_42_15]